MEARPQRSVEPVIVTTVMIVIYCNNYLSNQKFRQQIIPHDKMLRPQRYVPTTAALSKLLEVPP
jgi:hypothetical protein